MKTGLGYSFARVFYGSFLIWYGIVLMFHPQLNENIGLIHTTIDSIKNITEITNTTALSSPYINIDVIKGYSQELIFLIGSLLILGGLFCACGYSCSIHFILCGLLLDLLLIHNIFYYNTQKMKINVLKILSLLGGAYFTI